MAIFYNKNCLYICKGILKKKKTGKIIVGQGENQYKTFGEKIFRGK